MENDTENAECTFAVYNARKVVASKIGRNEQIIMCTVSSFPLAKALDFTK